MGRKTRMLAKKRLDKYYRLAKDEGYKSRAAFKLIQINREYNFLGNSQCLIDLCAAPGGWTQVAAKFMPLSSQIISVDIEKMKPIPGVVEIQADITTQKCKFEIKKHLHGYDVDCVLHDGSPNVTGAWVKDAYGQCELTLHALKLTTQFLKYGGIFITKIFRSADYNSLLWVIQQLFDNVTSYKPIASRQSSAEIYLICQGYLKPKKIDSRLLNPQFVFREIAQKKESISVMNRPKSKKNKPSRIGYDHHILYKTTSIMDYINSKTPEIILGEYNNFQFDIDDNNDSKLLSEHTATNEDIRVLLSDLQLLAKSDFRRLLKWRLKMIKYLDSLQNKDDNDNKDDDNKVQDDDAANRVYTQDELNVLEDETLEADVRDLFEKRKREKRKQKRKIRQAKIKNARIRDMGGIHKDDIWDIGKQEQEGEGLFKLNDFSNVDQLNNFMNRNHTVLLPNKLNKNKKIKTFYDKFEDSDHELEIESSRLDKLYQKYKNKNGLKTKKEENKLIKKAITLESDDDFSDFNSNVSDSDIDGDINMNTNNMDNNDGGDDQNAMDMDQIQGIVDDNNDNTLSGGGLVIDDKEFVVVEDTKIIKAKRWFSNNIFDDIQTDDKFEEKQMNDVVGDLMVNNDDKNDDFEIVPIKNQNKSVKSAKNNNKNDPKKDGKFKYKDLPEILKLPYKLRRKMSKMNRDHRRRLKREELKRKERDCLFEEVPTINKDDDDSGDDTDDIAEIRAIGSKMLFNKKSRMNIINSSYNRFAFDDDGCVLPSWFRDEEKQNYNINLPVTKEEIREYKNKLRAINSRPIKKIAEAKARKKLRATRAWNRIKRQATSIADNNEISERTKIKQIQTLYAKKLFQKKKDKVLMISSGGRAARPANGKKPPKNAPKVYVDKRLKADKLGTKHAVKRKLINKIKKTNRRQRNSKNKRRKRNKK